MDIIHKYFPDLDEDKLEKLSKLKDLYFEWNQKINVISRKDIDQLYLRHVLHSLSICKYTDFVDGTDVMDVGTGGGFPGIPLAIMFPNCNFHLVDSIGKKIKVVEAVSEALGLTNLKASHTRVQAVKEKYDFIVSRAVTAFPGFVNMCKNKIKAENKNSIANGIIYLKGGDFDSEVKQYGANLTMHEITDYFEEEFFETKKIIHLRMR
ncbi:MAG: 16S rRNA (guanine(527)-N(7))-methyltransferase RsmG [Marinifilaceae bacterium]|nr:16S rRNA (guanine(527)-N(7))-methyltransferase RsmG [Marinifilaceae bacterium]